MNLFLETCTHSIHKLEKSLSTYIGSFYIILLSLFFSLATLGVKLLSEVPIYQNIYTTSLVSLLLCILSDPSPKIPKNPLTYKLLIQRGILGTFGFITLNQTIHYLPMSLATLIIQLTPIWIGIAGFLFYKEHFGLVDITLTLTSFGGIVLIIQPEFIFGANSEGESIEKENLLIGSIFGIVFSMIAAAILMMVRNLKGRVNVVVILYYFNLFSVFFTAFGSNYEGVKTLNFKEFLGLIIVGIFYFLAQITRNRALYLEKAFFVGIGSYLQLIISYFLDFFVLGTELSGSSILGSFVVMVSIILMLFYDQRKNTAKNSCK